MFNALFIIITYLPQKTYSGNSRKESTMKERRFVKPQILTEGGAANWDWNYARLASHRAELLSMISS